MTQLNAYLSFDGNCAEAMRFYEKTLNGKLNALLTYGQTPVCDQTPEADRDRDRIMHAYLAFDGHVLMAGDAPTNQPYEPMRGITLTLSYDTVAQARRVSMRWPRAERSPCRSTRRSGRTDSGWWTTVSARTGSSTAA